MLIILETGRKEHLIRQCYTALASVLTMDDLLDWGLQDSRPAVVARNMIDWAAADDVTVQTMWGQHADHSGDESSGIAAAGGPAGGAAG